MSTSSLIMLSRIRWQKVCTSTAVLLTFCWGSSLPIFAQTSLPQPPSLNAASVDASGYVLGAGDEIALTVFGYDEYTDTKVILPDGTIALPLLGSIPAADRTTDQLAQELQTRLQAWLVEPVVTVTLTTLRPVIVNVSGAVQRPGPVQLRPLNDNTDNLDDAISSPTVITALTLAGGITPNADVRRVMLRRYVPSGNAEPITINLWDALWSDTMPQNLVLRDGDALYIPELPAGETLDRQLIARSSLSPATVRVRVVGEVNNPGEVQVPPNSSLSSAVAIAGGPTDDARLSQVAFVRMDEAGQVERQTIDLSNLTDTYQVQDGDVVIVPKKDSSSFLDLAGRATGPLGLLLNLFLY